MAEVTIGSRPYQTYASIESADDYLSASLMAATWGNLTENEKAVRLVEATRLLNRQSWRPAYRMFEARAAVRVIAEASIEIAGGLAAGEADVSVLDGPAAQAVRRSKVGPVEEEYFRSFDAASPLPPRMMAMLAPYLMRSGARTIGGAIATGVDGVSHATAPFGFARGI